MSSFRLASFMFVMAMGVWACSDGTKSADAEDPAAPPDEAPTAAGVTTSTAPTSSIPPPDGPTLHGVRYCEFLTVDAGTDGSATAEVWNTMGLNDCPQDAWDAVDLDEVRVLTDADSVAANGPRYWVLDRIVPGALAGSLEVKDLSGIEMRSIALVDVPDLAAESTDYVEVSVERDTLFTFAAGREIYELTAPDGSIYVMQSYSQQVDANLTVEDLASLGERLDPPASWTFASRVVTEDLEVEDLEGIATVVTDELKNTYQLRVRG